MKLKYLSWLPAVILMGVIFYFSSIPAVYSTESSMVISKVILKSYEEISNTWLQEPARSETLNKLDHIVRKSAHFFEYALLAMAIAFHFTIWKKSKRLRLLLPAVIAALYAVTDEIHQTYVEGRSGQLSDVFLDSTGAITGALCFGILTALCVYLRKAAQNKAAQKAISHK